MWRHFLISATFIKIRTSCALIRWLSQPNQMKLINFILTFPCASHRDAPNADFICKTPETHNIWFYLRKAPIFVNKIRRRPLASGGGRFFMTDFPRRALADWRRIFDGTSSSGWTYSSLRVQFLFRYSPIYQYASYCLSYCL